MASTIDAGIPLTRRRRFEQRLQFRATRDALCARQRLRLAHDAEGLRLDHPLRSHVQQIVRHVVAAGPHAGQPVAGSEAIQARRRTPPAGEKVTGNRQPSWYTDRPRLCSVYRQIANTPIQFIGRMFRRDGCGALRIGAFARCFANSAFAESSDSPSQDEPPFGTNRSRTSQGQSLSGENAPYPSVSASRQLTWVITYRSHAPAQVRRGGLR